MKEKIVQVLESEAARHDCRVLFAVESGSRAWGFASPDSDYDIRAVYVKPLDWYLGLEESKSDTWEEMLPGDLDISAWDLRKVLRQMLKCNCSLFEWIGSPIVYVDTGILARLAELSTRAFNPAHAAYHYASLFRHAMETADENGTISVKKLCYALRANAAVAWIRQHETMPPTEFRKLLEGIDLSESARREIDDLLVLKSGAAEKDRITPPALLADLLVDRLGEVGNITWRKTPEPPQKLRKDMERLFQSILKYCNTLEST